MRSLLSRPVLSRLLPRLAMVAALSVPLFALDIDVSAADCRAAAQRAASQSGGRVISARAVSGGAACEVTLLVPQAGGPPRRVVTTVPA